MSQQNSEVNEEKCLWDQKDALRQIKGESVRQNQALRDFAKIGPARTISKLYRIYEADIKKGFRPPSISEQVLYRWQKKYHWQLRLMDYSTVMQFEADARQVAHFEVYKSKKLAILEALAARVDEMLKFPVSRKETKANGTVIIVHPARWDYGTVANLLKTLNDIENLDNGKPTLRVKVDDIESMTDDELRGYLSERFRARTEADGAGVAGSGEAQAGPAIDSAAEPEPGSGSIH